MTRTALVINEKQDCQALESNLIKQQDFHKMSLKSIGQYWNHLRRCKYDKLWFSWRRQRAHCLPSIIDSTVCIVWSFSSHCRQELFLSLLESEGSDNTLVIAVPPEDTLVPVELNAGGWWCPQGPGSYLASRGLLSVTHLRKPWLWTQGLSAELHSWATWTSLPTSLPFPLCEQAHIFSLSYFVREERPTCQIFSLHLFLPHKL